MVPDDALDDEGVFPDDGEVDPDRIVGCGYWRCGELFEARSVNHVYCRKACRSRQKKWERAQARAARRASSRTR